MLTALATSLALLLTTPPPKTHPFGIDDLLAMDRVGDPQVSPDGKWVTFEVTTPSLEANKNLKDLWIAAVDGSSVRRLTTAPEPDLNARWMPDGKSIVFISGRGGSTQVWQLAVDGGGGEAHQLTRFPVGVDAMAVFPDGKRLLLSMEVYPDLSAAGALDETAKRDEANEKSKVKARAYDSLLFRHWDTWASGRRSHLFVWPLEGGTPADLMAGLDADCPTKPFGGNDDFAISPDGKEVAFTAKLAAKDNAWTTNDEVYRVPASGGKPAALTAENKAYDGVPSYSPDGKWLAYLSMKRPGFEADRKRVILVDREKGTRRELTADWDRDPSELVWAPDSKSLFTSADDLGRHGLFAIDAESGKVAPIVSDGHNSSPVPWGDFVVFSRDSLRQPAELYVARRDGTSLRQLTHLNDARLAMADRGETEQFSFQGAKGDKIYGWLIKPANAKPGKKYPVAFLVHGGPQGSFDDHFHYRWNAQMYSGAGYGVLMIDFHGSTGYGQAFTDSISGDWGGAPFEDLMKGLDAALAKYPMLDGQKACALGASYGGYMMSWFEGHTDRFKCIVQHDGIFDAEGAYYETEELWFPEWEFGGPPFEKRELYEKWSPMGSVASWKTPLLVVHGAQDFRVVETQGMAAFAAAQRRGIPSRFLYFPDENHWVLKPLNAARWYREVLDWAGRWTKK